MSSLFIVIPAYNEAENIERTVSEWYPIVENSGTVAAVWLGQGD